VHGAAISALVLSSPSLQSPLRPVYEEMIKPNEHKIIYYDLRKTEPVKQAKAPLPNVVPLKRVGRSPRPRARRFSSDTIIATSPTPQSHTQTIWLPAPRLQIHQDVPAPTLVARLNMSLPGPPREKPRSFAPPLPDNRTPRLPLPVPVLDSPSPSLSAAPPTPKPSLQLGMPALPGAPPGPVTSPGNDRADIAVANLNPDNAAALPTGARPGEFSKAPETGDVSTGAGGKGLAVPGLTLRGADASTGTVAPKGPTQTILYADRLRNVPLTTFSVPLRPATRTIPGSIDSRFRGRNVYTIVVPIENLPEYGGDWIIWFAESKPLPGDNPLMRAPVPYRKSEAVDPYTGPQTTQRIQIAATLGADGKLAQIVVLSRAGPALRQVVVDDAASWEFKPATRDGIPVAVELVLEIPFNLPLSVARDAGQ